MTWKTLGLLGILAIPTVQANSIRCPSPYDIAELAQKHCNQQTGRTEARLPPFVVHFSCDAEELNHLTLVGVYLAADGHYLSCHYLQQNGEENKTTWAYLRTTEQQEPLHLPMDQQLAWNHCELDQQPLKHLCCGKEAGWSYTEARACTLDWAN